MLMNRALDNRDQYDYGWNPKGQRFHALKSRRRVDRFDCLRDAIEDVLSHIPHPEAIATQSCWGLNTQLQVSLVCMKNVLWINLSQ